MRSTRFSKLSTFAIVPALASSQLPARASDAGALAATPRLSFNNWSYTHCRTELGLGMSRQYTMRDLWNCEQQPGDSSLKVSLAPHATAMCRISAR